MQTIFDALNGTSSWENMYTPCKSYNIKFAAKFNTIEQEKLSSIKHV